MKPSHHSFLLSALLCLAIFSCTENATETFPEPQEITISEVQDYYNRNNSGIRNRQLSLPEINWDSALFKDISIGQSILFPVEFDEIIYISGSDSTKAFKADLASYAFAYKEKDSLFLEFVQIVPTSNEALFTGYVSISDWGSGEIKRVDIYEDGLYAKTYMKGESDNNHGRSVCYEIITYYCTEREGPDDCVPVMYEYYCEEPGSLAGPEPNDYTEGGGGPGTGGNGMCEHPAMEGVFVRCDELITCPSGQEPDGYGNCIVICPDGFIHKEGEGCVEDKPCFGDPVKNPEIAPQTNSGMAGGLHGTCTRRGSGCASNTGKRMHDGVDIKNVYGAPVYAMYGGTATQNTQYKNGNVDGAGHYVSITSNVGGESVRLVYFHLQEAGRASGLVNAGDIIGYQGDSGNLAEAIQKKYTESHVHVKARSNGQITDPLNYFGTSIDGETGELVNPCIE